MVANHVSKLTINSPIETVLKKDDQLINDRFHLSSQS